MIWLTPEAAKLGAVRLIGAAYPPTLKKVLNIVEVRKLDGGPWFGPIYVTIEPVLGWAGKSSYEPSC